VRPARSPCWLTGGDGAVCNASEFAGQLLKLFVYCIRHNNKKRGGVMDTLETLEPQEDSNPKWGGFCMQDIIWAVGIWSVILTLSPVVMFYVLMVN